MYQLGFWAALQLLLLQLAALFSCGNRADRGTMTALATLHLAIICKLRHNNDMHAWQQAYNSPVQHTLLIKQPVCHPTHLVQT